MSNQLDGDWGSFPLDGMFLILSHIGFGTGYRKSDLFKIIFLSLMIMFDPIGWPVGDLGITLFSVPVGIFP